MSSTLDPTAADAFIPLSVPEIRGNEWKYVKDCLDTGWVSSVGSYVDRFERDFAEKLGVRKAVAAVNGTSAIHIALICAGVQPDDEVLVSSMTFIAPVNAIRYANAWPVLIDSEEQTWCMDPGLVVRFLEDSCDFDGSTLRNKRSGRRVRAILPVHILGHPVDMDPILQAARRYGLAVVEDATESLGARYKGQAVGTLGDLACFSFNGNKLLTTGGGGMIVTNHLEWGSRAKHLTTQAKADPLEYIHDEIGYNYRLTNLLAAFGCAQLEQLDAYLEKKREIAARYDAALAGIPGMDLMPRAPWADSALWLYTVRLRPTPGKPGSRELLQTLADQNIQTRPLWQPIHLSPAHPYCHQVPCPVAERLYAECLSLPCSVGLTEAQQDRVIRAVLRAFA